MTIENKYRDEHNRSLLEKERADVERTKQETANMRANVGLILANTDYARTWRFMLRNTLNLPLALSVLPGSS